MESQNNESTELNKNLFNEYHIKNPHIYTAFEKFTLQAMQKGFKNYGAKSIIELIRWHTDVSAQYDFKINNNYAPLYARIFEEKNPQHKGFLRMRKSRFDLKEETN